jgi:hypothetical protein
LAIGVRSERQNNRIANKEEISMRTVTISAIAMTFILVGGCDNAKSPDTVAKDVAAAEQKASTEVANSEKDASKDLGKAADRVDDKLVDLNNAAVRDAYNLTVAKADGNRKVAIANCLAASGDAQRACKDQADADYNAAVADAKAASQSDKR